MSANVGNIQGLPALCPCHFVVERGMLKGQQLPSSQRYLPKEGHRTCHFSGGGPERVRTLQEPYRAGLNSCLSTVRSLERDEETNTREKFGGSLFL